MQALKSAAFQFQWTTNTVHGWAAIRITADPTDSDSHGLEQPRIAVVDLREDSIPRLALHLAASLDSHPAA